MIEAISMSMVGPAGIGPGGIDPGLTRMGISCVFEPSLGKAAFTEISAKQGKEAAVKAMSLEGASLLGEKSLEIWMTPLKIAEVTYLDKSTKKTVTRETLIAPEFCGDTIQKVTDAGEKGTGTLSEWIRTDERVREFTTLATSYDGPVSLFWVSPGEEKDGNPIPHRAISLIKDKDGKVTEYFYVLPGSRETLSCMMDKLGWRGKDRLLEEKVISRAGEKGKITHLEVVTALSSSFTAEERTTLSPVLAKLHQEATLPDALRESRQREYQRRYEDEFRKAKDDIEIVLASIAYGFAAIPKVIAPSSQVETVTKQRVNTGEEVTRVINQKPKIVGEEGIQLRQEIGFKRERWNIIDKIRPKEKEYTFTANIPVQSQPVEQEIDRTSTRHSRKKGEVFQPSSPDIQKTSVVNFEYESKQTTLVMLPQTLTAFVYKNNTRNEDVIPPLTSGVEVKHAKESQETPLRVAQIFQPSHGAPRAKRVAPHLTGFLPRLDIRSSSVEDRVGRNHEPRARAIHPRVEPGALWFMSKTITEHKLDHAPKIANPPPQETATNAQWIIFERARFDSEATKGLAPWRNTILVLRFPEKPSQEETSNTDLDNIEILKTQPFWQKLTEPEKESSFREFSISESAKALVTELTSILSRTKKPDREVGGHPRKKETKKPQLQELENEIIILGWKTLYILLNHFTQEASVRRLAILLAAYNLPQTDRLHCYLSALIYRELQEVKIAKKETLPPVFIRKITELTKKASPLEERLQELRTLLLFEAEGRELSQDFSLRQVQDCTWLRSKNNCVSTGLEELKVGIKKMLRKRIFEEINQFFLLNNRRGETTKRQRKKIRLIREKVIKKEEKEKLYTALGFNLEKMRRLKKGALRKGKTKTKSGVDNILFEIGLWRKIYFFSSSRKKQTKKTKRKSFAKSGIIYRYQPYYLTTICST